MYEAYFTDNDKDEEDRVEWTTLLEIDPATGRVTQANRWKPFGRGAPAVTVKEVHITHTGIWHITGTLWRAFKCWWRNR